MQSKYVLKVEVRNFNSKIALRYGEYRINHATFWVWELKEP